MINIFLAIFLSFFIITNAVKAEIVVIDLSSRHNDNATDQSYNEETNNDLELFVEDSNLLSEENNSEEKIEDELKKVVDINNNLNNFSNIWKESSKKNIIFLLEKVTNQISSEVIKSNLTNFLIYGNFPPKEMEQAEFDKLRIMTLKKLDNVEAAIQVINNISTYENNKDYYDLIFLEKGLIDYNLSSVCSSLNSDSNFNTNTFLLKIMTLCSFLEGKKEEADFFNSLILEDSEDELFQALYNKLIGIETNLKNIQEYDYDKESISIYSAIMRTMDLKFSEDFVNLNSPELLKAIAISPTTDISIRIDAAQKAFKIGSLDSNSVAAIYQSVDFSSEELNNPISTINNKYNNHHQESMALLFQSSRIQILPISRLEALNNFWSYANIINQSKLAYELSRDLLKSIEPTSELIDFALQTARAHLNNDEIEESKKWLKLLEISLSSSDNETNKINKDYLQLIFLINLKEGRLDIEENLFNHFYKNLEISTDEISDLELYLTTLEYIGFNIPINLWEITAEKRVDNRTVPSIYIIKLLKQSSEKNLLGELFLNIAISMEDNLWSEIHPQHVGLIFDSLTEANKQEIVRNLALEILQNLN